jgi:DNA-binding GntR family transcriptional regulator
MSVPTSPVRRAPKAASPQSGAPERADAAEEDTQFQNAEDVFRRLRELIILGQLPAGAPVSERRVAERLKVSRTPVRTALQRLEQEGFVTSVVGESERRLSVAPMTAEDGSELWLMVGHLEGMAARKAAQLPTTQRKALASRMREVNKDLATSLRESVYATEAYDRDLEFHRLFVAEAAGPRLLRLHQPIKLQIERYARAYFGVLIGGLTNSVAEHDRVVRAIAAGEPEEAQKAIETNWYNASERLLRTIQHHGEKGNW